MRVGEALELLGGVATRARLVTLCTRSEVDRALAAGDLVALAYGRYAGPEVAGARAAAHRLTGVVSHLSAALVHGWEVARPPTRPTVPRRKVGVARAAGVDLRWGLLTADEVRGDVTTRPRTLLDSGRSLPWGDALAGPFESLLRSVAEDVPGLRVRPQVPQVPLWGAEFLGQPDLVEEDLRIVVEAESFA